MASTSSERLKISPIVTESRVSSSKTGVISASDSVSPVLVFLLLPSLGLFPALKVI